MVEKFTVKALEVHYQIVQISLRWRHMTVALYSYNGLMEKALFGIKFLDSVNICLFQTV